MKVLKGQCGEAKWTAMGMVINPATGKYENQGYVMIVRNAGMIRDTTQGAIEVRDMRGKGKCGGWTVRLYGEDVAFCRTKTEAQCLAEELV